MDFRDKQILVVDDEQALADIVKFNLEQDGFAVKMAYDAHAAIGLLSREQFDLVLLDVMLPEIDGYEICRLFRSTNNTTPVIFLTARGSASERIHGLRLGADDYMAKPFEYDELLLRIHKLLERSERKSQPVDDVFRFGECEIVFSKMEATDAKGRQQQLSKLEADMMKYFAMNEGKALSREEIYHHIWGYNSTSMPNSRTLDNFIMFLRKYFEKTPGEPKHILSVRGVGYKFVV